jgi:GT2 family glycosyltransferase
LKKTGKKSSRVSKQSSSYKVGLGIVTYNRPEYLKQVLQGVVNHLLDEVDTIWIYDDASTADYSDIYNNLHPRIQVKIGKKNKGVGPAKNWLMDKLIEENCYCVFIAEDDVIPVDKKAIRGYVQAARATGISHMMFAHHGPGNVSGALYKGEYVSVYPNCVGAWSFFTKPSLLDIGLHDENFHNAYEHVELTWRFVKAGLTTPWGAFADATGSEKWIKEIPGSIENSSIRKTKDWAYNSIKALSYWEQKDPEFPLKHILEALLDGIKKDDITTSTNKKKTK